MNQTAIITGASKGIGKATAKLFINKGWQVINLSRSSCDLAGVTNLQCDLSDSDSLAKIDFATYLSDTEKLVLIHNAATLASDNIQDIDSTKLRNSLEISLVAPLVLNQLLLPFMKPGSSIIYLGSTLSEKAVANAASYSIAKHAVVGMMRASCQDLASTGIHTCCICPGFTDTEMLRAHVGNDEMILSEIAQCVGANRLIQPQEIAKVIYDSAASAVLNGSVIHANLGQIER